MATSSRKKSGKNTRPDPNGPDHDPRTCPHRHLPSGQRTILGALAEHGSIKKAAKALHLSESTVKKQLESLRYKFQVDTNLQLVCAAAARGLIDATATPYTLTDRTCLGPQPK